MVSATEIAAIDVGPTFMVGWADDKHRPNRVRSACAITNRHTPFGVKQ